MTRISRLQPVFGANERSHAPGDESEILGELERAILAMYAVENMVPLFNKLVEHGYLTETEHAEFIQRYKLLARRLSPPASVIPHP